MEIYEKINHIIKEKNITKRKFSENLRALEPKLKSTGETPTEKTIYKYLNGNINIPIELISAIAETLNITEQELFDTSNQTKLKLLKYISKKFDKNQFDYINQINNHSTIISDIQNSYGVEQKNSNSFDKVKIEKLLSLLEFAPTPMIDKIIEKLEEIKKIALSDI